MYLTENIDLSDNGNCFVFDFEKKLTCNQFNVELLVKNLMLSKGKMFWLNKQLNSSQFFYDSHVN